MHVIRVNRAGRVALLPCSSWHFEGDADPDSWMVRATVYGPSTSTTQRLPFAGVVFIRWGSTPGQPYVGTGPLSWASATTRLAAEMERHMGDESSGARGQLIPVPSGSEEKLASLRADIAGLKGRTLLPETTAGGYGGGGLEAPRQDFMPRRLGATLDQSMVLARQHAFAEVLASCGTPPSLFTDADGTSQREAFRRYLTMTVQPVARVLAGELSAKLEGDVDFNFDALYAHDMVGRSSAFKRLVDGGVPVQEALQTSGLLGDS